LRLAQQALHEMYVLVGSDREVLADIVESFLVETPVYVEKLRSAVAAGDLLSVSQAAHALKSTGLDLGARTFSGMCKTIELECRKDSKLPTAAQLTELAGEAILVVEELRVSLQAIRNGSWPNGE
jgi:HPt (histidine-containing phosphotransfer) domain-containing protein